MPLVLSCTQRLAEPTSSGLDGIRPEPGGRQPSRGVNNALALGRAPARGRGRTLLRLPKAAERVPNGREAWCFPQGLRLGCPKPFSTAEKSLLSAASCVACKQRLHHH